MGGRGRGDHDGVDPGVVDHPPRVVGQVSEGAVARRRLPGGLRRVGCSHRHGLAVLSHLAQAVGMDLADHAAAHEPDPQRSSALGHGSGRYRCDAGRVRWGGARRRRGGRAGPGPTGRHPHRHRGPQPSGGGELVEGLGDIPRQVGQAGNRLGASHEAPVQDAPVAHDGDVQPRAVHDRAQGEAGHELGPGQVERKVGSRHIGDHQAVDRSVMLGELQPGVGTGRGGEHVGRGVLRPIEQHVRCPGRCAPLWPPWCPRGSTGASRGGRRSDKAVRRTSRRPGWRRAGWRQWERSTPGQWPPGARRGARGRR